MRLRKAPSGRIFSTGLMSFRSLFLLCANGQMISLFSSNISSTGLPERPASGFVTFKSTRSISFLLIGGLGMFESYKTLWSGLSYFAMAKLSSLMNLGSIKPHTGNLRRSVSRSVVSGVQKLTRSGN